MENEQNLGSQGTADGASATWMYAFGPYRLDPSRGWLTYGSEVVPLPERLMTILLALIRANGAVVTREELYALIWPDGGIGDNNLSQHVYMLRRILGERAYDKLYIATVHNKGFQFIAPISVVEPSQVEDALPPRPATSAEFSPGMLELIRHYGMGCQLMMRGHAANLTLAAEQFNLALKNNDKYVPALIGYARAFLSLGRNGYLSATQAFPPAKAALLRALQLDPSSAAGHAILSDIILCSEWNWRDAKREIDSAVCINAECSAVRTSLMWHYQWIGKPKRALLELQSAIAIEPSLPAFQIAIGRLLIACRLYDDAISHLSPLIERFSDYAARGRQHRALAFLLGGYPREALTDLSIVQQDRAENLAWRLPMLGRAYAELGDAQMAEQVYDNLLTAARTEYVAATNLIPLTLALGKHDEAVRLLELATARREPSLPLLRHSAIIDPLRKTDAFKALLNALARNAVTDDTKKQENGHLEYAYERD